MKTITKLIALLLLFTTCQSLNVSKFDAYSFEKTIDLKIKTLKLIAKSNENFNNNIKEVDNLLLELETHYEYEKHKPNNHITTAMWERLTNKDTSFIKSFFTLWKAKENLSAEFIKQTNIQTNEAFDKIIELETKKEQ